MRKLIILIYLSFATLVIGACSDNNHHLRVIRESPQYSFSNFIENIDTYPYESDKSKLDRVVNGYGRISIGMSKNEIYNVLGHPDAEFITYESINGHETFLKSSWAYYLHRHEKRLASEMFDKVVFIYFDINEKSYWALPTNIESLSEAGNPFNSKPANKKVKVTPATKSVSSVGTVATAPAPYLER